MGLALDKESILSEYCLIEKKLTIFVPLAPTQTAEGKSGGQRPRRVKQTLLSWELDLVVGGVQEQAGCFWG